MRWLILLALAAAASPAAAQIYRWVDQNGQVHYSNVQPPKNTKVTVVDADAQQGAPAPQSTECYTIRCQGERMEERQRKRDADEAKLAVERAQAAAKQPRGLDFRKYVSIQRGMSEGELLGIAGEPDLLVDNGGAWYPTARAVQSGRSTRSGAIVGGAMRTYTYLPTSGDPFTTTITLIGGRVSELERIRKF